MYCFTYSLSALGRHVKLVQKTTQHYTCKHEIDSLFLEQTVILQYCSIYKFAICYLMENYYTRPQTLKVLILQLLMCLMFLGFISATSLWCTAPQATYQFSITHGLHVFKCSAMVQTHSTLYLYPQTMSHTKL